MQVLRIGIRDAKINLSKLLKMVKKGQEVVITDRGKPVGKLVPFSNGKASLDERLKYMEEKGWIEPFPKGRKKLPPPLPAPDGIAQKFLQEERNSWPTENL
jgi:prevent-host-death family protein